jgi:hypothetical protein
MSIPVRSPAQRIALRRLYREERLQVRRRGGRKRALGTSAPMAIPQGPNQRWSLDFLSDAFADATVFASGRVEVLIHSGYDYDQWLVCPTSDFRAADLQAGALAPPLWWEAGRHSI